MTENNQIAERLIRYSPILQRPQLTWPGDARVAVMIVPNVEHYEYIPAFVGPRDPYPRSPHPDILGYSFRDYGNRVGLWRLFDVLDRFDVRATVSLNMAVIEHFPEILEAMELRRWEYMSHGIYNTRYHWGISEAEERASMDESRALHRRITGREQRGWFSPSFSNTVRTFDLAAAAGYDYVCDLLHDDQPFPLAVRSGSLLALPYTLDLNDGTVFGRNQEAAAFAQMIRDQFDTLYQEGSDQGRVMCIALHPFLIGQPHRIGHLRSALEYVFSHIGVWAATGSEIVDWFNTHHLAKVDAHLNEREVAHA